MKNPFRYGETVTGISFINREDEIEELVKDLKEGQNIFLYSPRRYGKTSLIIYVLNILRKEGLLTSYLDLYEVTSRRELLEKYAQVIALGATTKLQQIAKAVKEFFPNIQPKVTFTSNGMPSIGIDYQIKEKELKRFLEEIYDAPQKIAKKRKKIFVFVFDEFQEITNLDGVKIEKEMRARFQHHNKVSYVFMGSKKSLITEIFNNPNRPFYKMGKMMNLKKIPEERFKKFIINSFKREGFAIAREVPEQILEITQNIPYYTQLLCHEIWNVCLDTKKVTSERVNLVVEKIIDNQSQLFLTIWDALSLHQRRLIEALTLQPEKELFSSKFITENELISAGSVQSSIKILLKRGLVDKENGKYFIIDIFFREWIRRKLC